MSEWLWDLCYSAIIINFLKKICIPWCRYASTIQCFAQEHVLRNKKYIHLTDISCTDKVHEMFKVWPYFNLLTEILLILWTRLCRYVYAQSTFRIRFMQLELLLIWLRNILWQNRETSRTIGCFITNLISFMPQINMRNEKYFSIISSPVMKLYERIWDENSSK